MQSRATIICVWESGNGLLSKRLHLQYLLRISHTLTHGMMKYLFEVKNAIAMKKKEKKNEQYIYLYMHYTYTKYAQTHARTRSHARRVR